MLRDNAILILLFLALLYFLGCNCVGEVSCSEVSQVYQWRALCIRGIAAMPLMMAAFILVSRRESIVSCIQASIIAICVAEAACSILQLYGLLPSYHSLFKVTGSFYNPGPLGGYIALGIPVALNMLLNIGESQKIWKYALYAALAIVAVALPSTMSRTAWIAVSAAALYVLWANRRLESIVSPIKKRARLIMPAMAIALIASGVLMWKMKEGSANGRLFLWKISCRAIAQSPWIGHASFEQAYSQAQEDYFALGVSDYTERMVAAAPECAFNEYLQIGVEHGAPAMIAAIALMAFLLIAAHRSHCRGLSGAIISLMIFAFASYPMHLPAFVSVLALIAIAVLASIFRRGWMAAIAPAALLAFCAIQLPKYNDRAAAMRKWTSVSFLYNSKVYHGVAEKYAPLLDAMRWNPRFLYEYGHSLYKTGKYADALSILVQALPISTDPMVLNIMGECHQALQEHQEAEYCYKRSALRIPSRLYPHYLLYFLYCEDGFQNPELRRQEYGQVMSLDIKKESPATRDLRRKVEEREAAFNASD